MAQRKSLNPTLIRTISTIFFLISVVVINKMALADAWTVKPGQYKYSGSFLLTDSKSIEKKLQREDAVSELLANERALYKLKDRILERNLAQNKPSLSNSDKLLLEQIDLSLSAINKQIRKLSQQTTARLATIGVEYGLDDKSSFGLNACYEAQKFMSKSVYGKSADFIYKYSFLQRNNLVLTIAPKISFNNYLGNKNKIMAGGSLLLGYSKTSKSGTVNFNEFGLHTGGGINNNAVGQRTFAVSSQEGIKFTNGLMFSNYSIIEILQSKNNLKEYNFFNQFSVAKDLSFANLPKRSATIQLGYFWKGSIDERDNIVAGPIISLWMTI